MIQTRSETFQDRPNFPVKLNDKLAAMAGVIGRGEHPATEQAVAVFEELSRQLEENLYALEQLEKTDMSKFNKLVASHNVPAIIEPKTEDAH